MRVPASYAQACCRTKCFCSTYKPWHSLQMDWVDEPNELIGFWPACFCELNDFLRDRLGFVTLGVDVQRGVIDIGDTCDTMLCDEGSCFWPCHKWN